MYDESVQLLLPDEFKHTAFREFQAAPALIALLILQNYVVL